jgi:nucleoside-triphosphatase THEP1
MLDNGQRVGFEIEDNKGNKAILSHVNFKSDKKVSRYFVDIKNLDNALSKIDNFGVDDILYIDEIGEMELFSDNFKQIVLKYLDSPNICIVTLSEVYSDSFTEKIRQRDDIIMVKITPENRNAKEKFIFDIIGKIRKAKKYISERKRFNVNSDETIINTDHGVRNLRKINSEWVCDCQFFKDNGICSHIIALKEYIKIYS